MSLVCLLLLVTLQPVHVCAYNVFIMPIPGKSHVFSMAAMTEGLVSRGHKVTFFIGENFRLNVAELQNVTEVSVVRYRDTADGLEVDYDAMHESITRAAIESVGDTTRMISTISDMYATCTSYCLSLYGEPLHVFSSHEIYRVLSWAT